MGTRTFVLGMVLALATLALGCGDAEMADEDSALVATADSALTDIDTPVRLRPTANDVAGDACVAAQTIDLDPATPGQQGFLATPAGTFVVEPGGDVVFTPVPGFSGQAIASYVVADVVGRLSNPAALIITIRAARTLPSSAEGNTVPLGDAGDVLPRLIPAALVQP